MQLDFFLSTSSIAAVWGSFGQTAYSAANAFLDGLAWRLRERGVPGVSVNFGPWSAGMGDRRPGRSWNVRGVRALSPADALAGMAELIGGVGAARDGGPDRLGPLPAVLQLQRKRALLTHIEREVPEHGAGTELVRDDTVGRASSRCARAAAQDNWCWSTCATRWRR